MAQFTVTISDEEEKALLTDILSIQEWLDEMVDIRARQCINKICKLAIEDKGNIILTAEEKEDVVADLSDTGELILSFKDMPKEIKNKIVQKARVESAAERQMELEMGEILAG